MIVETKFNGLISRKSDNNKFIQKVGTEEYYIEAIDVESSTFEYVETEQDIPEPEMTKEMMEYLQNKENAQ